MPNIRKFIVKGSSVISQNLPLILTGLGVAGVIGTAFLSSKATLKADEKLKELEATGRELTHLDIIREVYPYYIPAVAAGLGTIGCIVGAGHVSATKLAAMTATAATIEKKYLDNRDAVKEVFGDKGLRKIDEKINETRMIEYVSQTQDIHETGHGNVLCCEGFLTGMLFHASREWIGRCINEFNNRVVQGETLSYNDFLESLIPTIDPNQLPDIGYRFGYNMNIRSSMLEIVEDSFLLPDGSAPVFIFTLREIPLFNYDEQM